MKGIAFPMKTGVSGGLMTIEGSPELQQTLAEQFQFGESENVYNTFNKIGIDKSIMFSRANDKTKAKLRNTIISKVERLVLLKRIRLDTTNIKFFELDNGLRVQFAYLDLETNRTEVFDDVLHKR